MLKRALVLAAALAAAAPLLPATTVHAAAAAAQETGSLEGAVFDASTLQPLAGVSVSVIDSDQEATTDELGVFSLAGVPAGTSQLRLRRPGYSSSVEDVEVTAGERTFVQLSVIDLAHVLDELLVQGRRGERSLNEVRSDDNHTARTATDLLAARVPGLSLSTPRGNVGTGADLRIRGISTFSGDGTPLIVVDGVRLTGEGPGGFTQGLSILNEIPADQVESIRVLKGPASASQYPFAANGVIEIRTRSASDRSN